MKLVHVVPALTQEASGPSYSVRRLCDVLVKRGHDVTLAALNWAPLLDAPPYLKLFPIGMGPSRLGVSSEMRHWLRHASRGAGISLIHNHGMWQMNALYPACAIAGTTVHLMQSPRGAFSHWAMQHGSPLKNVFWPLLQRPALQKASCFHATAEAEYHDIRRLGFHQPVAVIPNGIDLPEVTPKHKSDMRTLLFLGRIHVVKGLDALLKAWERIQSEFPHWRLVIAGTDDGYHGISGYLQQIKAMARNLDLKRIEFPGPIFGLEKMQAYRDADLYVLPSYSENFAVTVAEALSCATPALVSKGAPWAGLSAKDAGWWIDIGVEPLTAALREAMSQSPSHLSAMGVRGRAWMNEEFSWSEIGTKMSETYEWICDRSLPTPPWVRLD